MYRDINEHNDTRITINRILRRYIYKFSRKMNNIEKQETNTFKYKKISIDDNNLIESKKYLDMLMELSKQWAYEKIASNYNQNDESEFKNKDIWVVLDGDIIIAYAFGHIKTVDKNTSYSKISDIVFELDEIYVSKQYRNLGIGKQLYYFLENDIKDKVDLIDLIASSYCYKELLKFYIDELGFMFNYALLVKRID